MTFPEFKYPVYNPSYNVIDVARDWVRFPNWTIDPELALSQPFKIATVCAGYTTPGHFTYRDTIPKVDLSRFDLVIISDAEYYTQAQILEWARQERIDNYLIAVGGIRMGEPLQKNIMYRPYWLTYFLDTNPEYVDTYSDQKPYLFDALLGSQRPHRDYVMLGLTKTGLLDQSIVTYRDCFPGNLVNKMSEQVYNEFPGTVLNRPYVSPNLLPEWEVTSTIDNTISFYTPFEIYKRTCYSIVCETISTGNGFFFSEKMMKPMFAKRPFVLFGPKGYLAQLRKLGFQTFNEYLDESYDDEPVDTERYKKAMMQIMRLAWLETPAKVKHYIDYVLDCNHARLFSWQQNFRTTMSEMIDSKVPSRHFNWT